VCVITHTQMLLWRVAGGDKCHCATSSSGDTSKGKVYRKPVHSVRQLKNRIRDAVGVISETTLRIRDAVGALVVRIRERKRQRGRYMEHVVLYH
jgi:hypothetical protein